MLGAAVLGSGDSVVANRLRSSGLCTSVETRKVGIQGMKEASGQSSVESTGGSQMGGIESVSPKSEGKAEVFGGVN